MTIDVARLLTTKPKRKNRVARKGGPNIQNPAISNSCPIQKIMTDQGVRNSSPRTRHGLPRAAAASSRPKTRAFTTWTLDWATAVPRLRLAAAKVDEGLLFPLAG